MDLIQTGKFISELRKDAGYTQEAFGEKLGVTNKTVSRWETGLYMPPADVLLKMSEMFDVSVNEILSGKRLADSEYKEAAEENIKQTVQMQLDRRKLIKRNIIIGLVSLLLIIAIVFLEKFLANWALDLNRNYINFYFTWAHQLFFRPVLYFITGGIIAYNIRLYTKYEGNRIIFWIALIVTSLLFVYTMLAKYEIILGILGVNNEYINTLSAIVPCSFEIVAFLMQAANYYYVFGFVIVFFKAWKKSRFINKSQNSSNQ